MGSKSELADIKEEADKLGMTYWEVWDDFDNFKKFKVTTVHTYSSWACVSPAS